MARQTEEKKPLVRSAKQGSIETANRARADIASTNRAPSHHPEAHHDPGKSSSEFAKGKPLELIEGGGLLHLLAEHAGIEARIVVPDS